MRDMLLPHSSQRPPHQLHVCSRSCPGAGCPACSHRPCLCGGCASLLATPTSWGWVGWVVSGEARAAEQAEDGVKGHSHLPTSSPSQLGSFWFSLTAPATSLLVTRPQGSPVASDHPSNTLQSAQDPLQPLTLGLTHPSPQKPVVLGPRKGGALWVVSAGYGAREAGQARTVESSAWVSRHPWCSLWLHWVQGLQGS